MISHVHVGGDDFERAFAFYSARPQVQATAERLGRLDDSRRGAAAAAPAHGGSSEGPPGLRPHYRADDYGAHFRDPAANKLCVCRHQPEPT